MSKRTSFRRAAVAKHSKQYHCACAERLFWLVFAILVSFPIFAAERGAVSDNHTLADNDNQLIVKQATAQQVLLLLYALTNHSSGFTNEQKPLSKRLLKQELVTELKQLLAEIEALTNLTDGAKNQTPSVRENTQDTSVDKLVARLEPAPKQGLENREKKFPWPLGGDIISTPGNAFRRGGAKWPGVLIDATAGSEVKAISGGNVVYAGEMKHLGLLVIVDHQDGYLSLYGRNTELFVKQNEQVSENQTLAVVSHAAGNEQSALYFEIRREGTPIDPRLVCSKDTE